MRLYRFVTALYRIAREEADCVDATNIEIKVNIGGDVDSALAELGLGEGKRRTSVGIASI